MRILFLSRWFPVPPDNGSRIRILNVIKQLSRRHGITLLSFGDRAQVSNGQNLLDLRQYCSDIQVVPYRPFRPTSAAALLGLISRYPRSLVDTFSHEMRAAVEAAVKRHKYELVVASQLDMVPYALTVTGVPALLEELEVSVIADAASFERAWHKRLRSRLTWLKLAAYLRRTLPRFAACTVVSDLERGKVSRVAPGYRNIEVVPNAVDLAHYDGDFGVARPNTLLFCGALSYSANFDAVRHFLSMIYPTIVHAVPGVELRVTGATNGVDLTALPPQAGVSYTGWIPDIRPVVAQSWVSVMPLRLGGGTRLKILEAMALGTPAVSTSKGAEGLDVTHGENILLADGPSDFASSVTELLRSAELRERLAAGGRRLVESKYDWRVTGDRLSSLVEQLAA